MHEKANSIQAPLNISFNPLQARYCHSKLERSKGICWSIKATSSVTNQSRFGGQDPRRKSRGRSAGEASLLHHPVGKGYHKQRGEESGKHTFNRTHGREFPEPPTSPVRALVCGRRALPCAYVEEEGEGERKPNNVRGEDGGEGGGNVLHED